MAIPAAFATNTKFTVHLVGHCEFVYMAILTFQIFMNGMPQIRFNNCVMIAGLMAVYTAVTVDILLFVILWQSKSSK